MTEGNVTNKGYLAEAVASGGYQESDLKHLTNLTGKHLFKALF